MDYTRNRVLSVLKENGELKITDLAERLGLERHTVAKHLEALESNGLARKKHEGKSKLYSHTEHPLLEMFKKDDALSENIKKILDLAEHHISIQNKDYEVIWNNKDKNAIGSKCYEAYADRETPCPNCTADKVIERGTPDLRTIELSGEKSQVKLEPVKNEDGDTVAFFEVAKRL